MSHVQNGKQAVSRLTPVAMVLGCVALGVSPAGAADAPIRYWRLGESGATTIAVDRTGNQDGTYTASPVTGADSLLAADTADGAVQFNSAQSVAQSVEIPNHAEINDDGDPGTTLTYTRKTVELWFQTADATPRQVLYEQGGAARGLNAYLEGGRLYLSGWNTSDDDGSTTTPWGGTGAEATAVSTPVGEGAPHHVVLLFNGDASGKDGSITGFLDGRPFGQVYGVGRLFEDPDPIAVGKQRGTTHYHDTGASSSGDTDYFNGVIDEVALYDKVLATEQVQIHAADGRGEAVSHGVYGDAVLADHPLAYWQLGELDGDGAVNVATRTTVGDGLDNAGDGLDNAADGRHVGGTLLNAVALLPGADNGAAAYNGIDAGTKIPNHAEINGGGTYPQRTIELWFNASNVDTPGPQVLYEEGGTTNGLNVYVEQGEVRVGAWTNSGAEMFVNFATSVGSGETHHVVLSLDDNQDAMIGMLDGKVFGAARNVEELPSHPDGIGIGHMNEASRFDDGAAGSREQSGDGLYFAGSIDDVALFNRGLTVRDVRDHLAAAGVSVATDAYEQAVQADSPLAYWRLSDTAGNGVANEATGGATLGNDVTGLVKGGVDRTAASLLPTIADTAADFDSTASGAVDVPDDVSINSGNVYQRTLELWFNADDVIDRHVLYEEGNASNGLNAYVDESQVHVGAWNSNQNVMNHFLDAPIEAGQTYHLVLTFEANGNDRMIGLLNGRPFAGVTGIQTLNTHGGDIGIGAMNQDTRIDDETDDGFGQSGDGLYFDGRIDEVALYNWALSIEQVQKHYVVGSGDWMGITHGVSGYDATLGVMLNYDASVDNDGNGTWEDTIGSFHNNGQPNRFDWTLGDVTRVGPDHGDSDASRYPGIDHAYRFVSGAMTASFDQLYLDPSQNDASFEIWFKPEDLIGQEMLFESGGNIDGVSIRLNGSSVEFEAQGDADNDVTVSFDLDELVDDWWYEDDEFIQVLGVYRRGGELELYANGLRRAQEFDPELDVDDWAGVNAAGLGVVNNAANVDGYGEFRGQIAILRFFDRALTTGEVIDNYAAVTGIRVNPPISANWRLTGSGTFNDSTYWSGGYIDGIPDGVDASANFLDTIAVPSVVTVDSPVRVGTMTFRNANSYTIAGPAEITFDKTTGPGEIDVQQGDHTITAPFAAPDGLEVHASFGTSLTLDPAAQALFSAELTKSGLGTLVLSDKVVVTGPVEITAGVLEANGTQMQPGGDLTLNGPAFVGATLRASGLIDRKVSNTTSGDSIVATGTLTMGDPTDPQGVNLEGPLWSDFNWGDLQVGSHTVNLVSAPWSIPPLGDPTPREEWKTLAVPQATLGGGTLASVHGIHVVEFGLLQGEGTVDGNVTFGHNTSAPASIDGNVGGGLTFTSTVDGNFGLAGTLTFNGEVKPGFSPSWIPTGPGNISGAFDIEVNGTEDWVLEDLPPGLVTGQKGVGGGFSQLYVYKKNPGPGESTTLNQVLTLFLDSENEGYRPAPGEKIKLVIPGGFQKPAAPRQPAEEVFAADQIIYGPGFQYLWSDDSLLKLAAAGIPATLTEIRKLDGGLTLGLGNPAEQGWTPEHPKIPNTVVGGTFRFEFECDENEYVFVDSAGAIGYEFTVSPGNFPSFASVLVPDVLAGLVPGVFELWFDDGSGFAQQADLLIGESYLFPEGGVDFFRMVGIDPGQYTVDNSPPVFGLSFVHASPVSLEITAIAIPEPGTLIMLLGGVLGMLLLVRRRRPPS